MELPNHNKCKIAIIGLGYVGLPLAIEFSKIRNCLLTGSKLSRQVVGFDISESRVNELNNGFDKTNEIFSEDLERPDVSFLNQPKTILKFS